MKKNDLTSDNISKIVIFEDDWYSKDHKKYITSKVTGIIDCLLLDINYGAYGYTVITQGHKRINFIVKDNHPEIMNLIGRDLSDLTLL
jgi:hypothetical protein